MTVTTGTTGRLVRNAMIAVLGRRASAAERERIARIEAVRRELAASGEVIERVDFGAGEGVPLAEAAHHAGVTVSQTVGEFCRRSSVSPVWSRLLFHLVRGAKPAHALELGTALGISAAYQGAALELNGHGRLVTIEGARPFAEIAERNLERLGIGCVDVVTGRFVDALPTVLDDLRPLDYAYVDGHHDGRATLEYFDMLLNAIDGPALLVFDDIGISTSMTRAWAAITRHPRIGLAVSLRKLGVCEVP
jgi:predicted O-methyltransferase YrrM